MFGSSIRLPVTIAGIPIRLDTSFLLVLPLFAWLIASQIPEYATLLQRAGYQVDPDALTRGLTEVWLGITAAVGLFLSVLVHELGHAFTARIFGVRVEGITLWFLGGVAQFPEMPKGRGREAIIGIAGPITSVALAGLFYLLWTGPAWGAAGLFVASYLTITNAALAAFNMLPALPLDGGRVLRSLLALGMPYLRATRISAGVSRVVAILLGIYGILTFQLFIALIAFFIYTAVQAEAQYAVMSEVFEGVTVRDIMTEDVVTVDDQTTLRALVEISRYQRHSGYPVVDEAGRVVGVVKLQDVQDVDEAQRSDTLVADVMHEPETVTPDTEVEDALKTLAASELGRLAVVRDDRVVGVLSKSDIVRELQVRAGQRNRPGAPGDGDARADEGEAREGGGQRG